MGTGGVDPPPSMELDKRGGDDAKTEEMAMTAMSKIRADQPLLHVVFVEVEYVGIFSRMISKGENDVVYCVVSVRVFCMCRKNVHVDSAGPAMNCRLYSPIHTVHRLQVIQRWM